MWTTVAIAVVIGVLAFLRSRSKKEPDPVALVMLLKEPRVLTMSHIISGLERAGLSCPMNMIVEEGPSYFRLPVNGFELTITSPPVPYLAISAESTREIRMKEAIETHTGCMLIDAWKAPQGKSLEDGLPIMGRLLAQYIDDYSLAVISTVTSRFNMVSEEMKSLLAEGNVDEAVNQMGDAILNVEAGDVRMVRAVKEARTRWPEFVAAWNQASDRQAFIAKFPFGEGERVEFMWISPTAINGDEVTGTLMNKPMRLPRPKLGDSVTVSVEDLNDWMFVENGEPIGAFTESIVRGG